MRRVGTAWLTGLIALAVLDGVLLLAPPARAEESEPIRAGKIAARYFPDGLGYAVYAPKTWRRRKPAALVVHVAMSSQVPLARMRNCVLPQEADQAARDGFLALHVMVLTQAHNKENTLSRSTVDRERWRVLLGRDIVHVEAVIEAVAAEAPIRRDAVFIRGFRFSGEAALGIAMRRPDTFAGAMAIDMICSTIGWAENTFQLPWTALPEGEALTQASRLPIFLTHLKGMGDTAKKARKVALMQELLKGQGFRRVDAVTRTQDSDAGYFMTPEGWAWLGEIATARARQTRSRSERDALVADGLRQLDKNRLASAIRLFQNVRALEAEASLEPAATALYEKLVEMGREILRKADAEPASKRKAAYRKMAKLFEGTPFGDEVTRALEGLP